MTSDNTYENGNKQILTLVIPTYNRPHFLERLLRYYQETSFPYPIIVADSSSEPALELDRNNIVAATNVLQIQHKLYHPDIRVLLKIAEVLELVESKYVVFCADDDFFIPSAILKCVEFLERKPGYVSAQAHYLSMKQYPESKRIYFRPLWLHTIGMDINADSASERVRQLLASYMNLFYSVTRTESAKKVWQAIVKNTDVLNDILLELAQAAMLISEGKHAILPIYYGVRDETDTGIRSSMQFPDRLPIIRTADKYKVEYESFINLVSGYLAEFENLPYDISRDNLLEAIENSNLVKDRVIVSQTKSQNVRLPRYIKDLIRKNEIIWFIYRKLIKSYRTCMGVGWQIIGKKDIDEFPFHDEEGQREMEKIRRSIRYFYKEKNILWLGEEK